MTYPIEKPYQEGFLPVSQKHQIFYALYGNPKGKPVIILHGGPGCGCSDDATRFFDLQKWHVIMMDQRGAMRSKPFGCMEENTTADLVEDIERLRKHLGIEKWVVFGGSWGSCLGIAYGQQFPDSCVGFILRGIFLARNEDLTLFKEMGKISKEAYENLLRHIPEVERSNVPSACYRRIMDPDPKVHLEMARAIYKYDMENTKTPPSPLELVEMMKDDRFILSLIRASIHYTVHQFFLKENQLISNIGKIEYLPAILVHGTDDTICIPNQAVTLHKHWRNSTLHLVEGAGHFSKHPGIESTLVAATKKFL